MKLRVKSSSCLQITAKQQYCPFFTVFLAIKPSSQNISITLLQISLKLHDHRGRYWRKKLPWTILEEQLPVPRYTAASKIGNSVISLLWQLRCRCNPDHNKFSSLFNTTVVAIFPKLCLWRRSLCSNLGGIDPEKLYRATLTSWHWLFHRLQTIYKSIIWPATIWPERIFWFNAVHLVNWKCRNRTSSCTYVNTRSLPVIFLVSQTKQCLP